jgi:hypothetical protein
MPILKNQRHESFARELARGKSATESYIEAGYHPCRQNASRLASNDDVKKRVAELQEQPNHIAKIDGRDPGTGRFLAGNTGGGRQRGSRNKLAEAFITDLHEEWEKRGKGCLERVARDDPVQFMKVVASILPRELDQTLTVDFNAGASFLEAFRLARRQIADPDDPLLLELQPNAAAE